jgi:hypothetical protein
LRTHILQAPRLHLDDTTLPQLERGGTTTRQAHLWGYLGAGQRLENGLWVDHPPAALFEFAESHARAHPPMRKRTATDAKERASWSPMLHDPLSTTCLP